MLTENDLKVGKTYRGKRSRDQDRTVVWISPWKDSVPKVKYDSESVRRGWKYPSISVEAFLKWAKEEVVKDAGTSIAEQ